MADWIAEIARIEAELAAEGVPPQQAMRVSALYANAMAQRDRAVREAQRAREAARLLPFGAEVVAERQGCHRATAYRRARRAMLSHAMPADATSG